MKKAVSLPSFGKMAWRIVHRNYLAWKKYALASSVLNFGEPVLELLAFGYGLGTYIYLGRDMNYLVYLAPGLLAAFAMTSASWDMAFCVHERSHTSGVYEAMISAPVRPEDISGGEILWEGFRSTLFGSVFLLMLALLGLVHSPLALLAPVLLFITGLIFGPPAMVVALAAKTSEQMFFYFTLCLTPMFFFSGVYFPTTGLPPVAQMVVEILPLSHVVRLMRLLLSEVPCDLLVEAAWIIGWLSLSLLLPVRWLRKNLTC